MHTANPAQRRYGWRFGSAMTLYAVALWGAKMAIAAIAPQGVALAALSVLPALPLLAAIAIMGLYLTEEQDEYLRAQTVRGMLLATGMVLAACTVWGFLEEGGVAVHAPVWTAFPLWAICLGLAQGYCQARAWWSRDV